MEMYEMTNKSDFRKKMLTDLKLAAVLYHFFGTPDGYFFQNICDLFWCFRVRWCTSVQPQLPSRSVSPRRHHGLRIRARYIWWMHDVSCRTTFFIFSWIVGATDTPVLNFFIFQITRSNLTLSTKICEFFKLTFKLILVMIIYSNIKY